MDFYDPINDRRSNLNIHNSENTLKMLSVLESRGSCCHGEQTAHRQQMQLIKFKVMGLILLAIQLVS